METSKAVENKLALEHLAKHLPYGLKIMNHYIDDEHLFEDDKISTLGATSNCILKSDSSSTISIYSVLEHQFKPILRPLSDLTKEITNNGETLVPVEIIKDLRVKIGDIKNLDDLWVKTSNPELSRMRYIPENLIYWHFDVDGLIDKGLAIDVNTLEHNPYK